MAKVWNWQIKREMEYPYEGAEPKRQFAFVFNINRCIACQTCTMACKSTWTFGDGQELMWWNNVETKPYGGYPRGWDVKILSLLEENNPGGQRWNSNGSFEGKTVFEAAKNVASDTPVLGYLPSENDWRAPNFQEDVAMGEKNRLAPGRSAQLPTHGTWFFYLQRLCNHCSYPACLAACPRKAIYKREEDGVVLIDQKRCRGYRKCVEACPYKKAMFRPTTQTSEKCIACYPRLEGRDPTIGDGAPIETRCMSVCVGKIRMQGLVRVNQDGSWRKDPDHPLYYLVHEEKVALPLYPQFGTQPNGYYIPPRWVPVSYLKQMFGPGVETAVERYVAPSRRLLAVLQLFRATRTILGRFKVEEGPKIAEAEVTLPNGKKKTQAIYNDTVIGYDMKGREAVRITVEEPIYVRTPEHYNSL